MLCEKCGKAMQSGYGLAGGGIGPYFYCETEGCGGFKKFQDAEINEVTEKDRTKSRH
jgi:hypothetical protein